MFVDWFKNVSAIFVDVYEIYATDTTTRVQILNETDCISHSTNILGKGMNPIILPPTMGK